MEEWDLVNDRDLLGLKGDVVCMTSQHFAYGVDRYCRIVVGYTTSGGGNSNRVRSSEARCQLCGNPCPSQRWIGPKKLGSP